MITSRLKQVMERITGDIRTYGLGILIAIAAMVMFRIVLGAVCPFRALLHIPCPGCGLTRSCVCILSLRFVDAFRWNPAGYLWLPFLAGLLYFRYVRGKTLPHLTAALIIVCLGSFLQWILRFFPALRQAFYLIK